MSTLSRKTPKFLLLLFCTKENASADRARLTCGKESQKTIKGSPSHETVNSLAMVQRGLKEAIDDLSDMSQNEDLKFVTRALPTLVNEHVFAKARELGFNEAVGCLDFAINFPTIVDEVMKRISKLHSSSTVIRSPITKFP